MAVTFGAGIEAPVLKLILPVLLWCLSWYYPYYFGAEIEAPILELRYYPYYFGAGIEAPILELILPVLLWCRNRSTHTWADITVRHPPYRWYSHGHDPLALRLPICVMQSHALCTPIIDDQCIVICIGHRSPINYQWSMHSNMHRLSITHDRMILWLTVQSRMIIDVWATIQGSPKYHM